MTKPVEIEIPDGGILLPPGWEMGPRKDGPVIVNDKPYLAFFGNDVGFFRVVSTTSRRKHRWWQRLWPFGRREQVWETTITMERVTE